MKHSLNLSYFSNIFNNLTILSIVSVSFFSNVPVSVSAQKNSINDLRPSTNQACSNNQFRAEYFNNRNLEGQPTVIKCDNDINKDWKTNSPDPSINKDNFSVRWTSTQTLEAGKYTFKTKSDDGVRLFVNDQQIINDWNKHAVKENRGNIEITSNPTKIVMEYFEAGGSAVARLEWEKTETSTPKPTISKYVPGSLIVTLDREYGTEVNQKIKDITGLENLEVEKIKNSTYNITSTDISSSYKDLSSAVAIDTIDEKTKEVLGKLNGDPSVKTAEIDELLTNFATTNDPSINDQWHLNNTGQLGGKVDTDVDAFEGWNVNPGSDQVVVAVIDDGMDVDHPDLAPNIYRDSSSNLIGYDFFENDTDPDWVNPDLDWGHGTHVGGLIAAKGNNSLGVSGVCQNCKLMPVRFLGPLGGTTSDAIASIYFATDNGANVINNSWGGGSFNQQLQDAMNYAYNNNVFVVASAGNSGSDLRNYPASYDNVFSVASLNNLNKKSLTSTYNAAVDISTPGEAVISTFPAGATLSTGLTGCNDANYLGANDGYGKCTGTSMAAPVASGVAAVLLSQKPTLTPFELETIIENTSKNIYTDNPTFVGKLGAGRASLGNAIQSLNAPMIVKQSAILDDSTSNNNTLFETSETVQLSVTIRNVGADASNLNLNVSTAYPNVTITPTSTNIGNMLYGETRTIVYTLTSTNANVGNVTLNFNAVATGYTGSFTHIVAVTPIIKAPYTWNFDSNGMDWKGTNTAGISKWYVSSGCATVGGTPRYWHFGNPVNCGSYLNSQSDELISPVIELDPSNTQPVFVSFDQYLDNEFTSTIVYDRADVLVKELGQDNTQAVSILSGQCQSYSMCGQLAWENKKFALPASFIGKKYIQIIFKFSSDISIIKQGWFVDNITIAPDAPIVGDIVGTVFEDKNLDSSENDTACIANTKVELLDINSNPVLDSTNNPVQTTSVNNPLCGATPNYKLNNVAFGQYRLRFTPQSTDYIATKKLIGIGNSNIDENTRISEVFEVSASNLLTSVEAGFFKPSIVGGMVFDDKNLSGNLDAGDTFRIDPAINISLINTSNNGLAGNINENAIFPSNCQSSLSNPLNLSISHIYWFNCVYPGQYKIKVTGLTNNEDFTIRSGMVAFNPGLSYIFEKFTSTPGETANFAVNYNESVSNVGAGIIDTSTDMETSITVDQPKPFYNPGDSVSVKIRITNLGPNPVQGDAAGFINPIYSSYITTGAQNGGTRGVLQIGDYNDINLTFTINSNTPNGLLDAITVDKIYQYINDTNLANNKAVLQLQIGDPTPPASNTYTKTNINGLPNVSEYKIFTSGVDTYAVAFAQSELSLYKLVANTFVKQNTITTNNDIIFPTVMDIVDFNGTTYLAHRGKVFVFNGVDNFTQNTQLTRGQYIGTSNRQYGDKVYKFDIIDGKLYLIYTDSEAYGWYGSTRYNVWLFNTTTNIFEPNHTFSAPVQSFTPATKIETFDFENKHYLLSNNRTNNIYNEISLFVWDTATQKFVASDANKVFPSSTDFDTFEAQGVRYILTSEYKYAGQYFNGITISKIENGKIVDTGLKFGPVQEQAHEIEMFKFNNKQYVIVAGDWQYIVFEWNGTNFIQSSDFPTMNYVGKRSDQYNFSNFADTFTIGAKNYLLFNFVMVNNAPTVYDMPVFSN